ncbi:hypothetical protein A9K55_004617 [Cordyceps militaris]|uniref:Uncharacterized protein n=1 Tax=Cordyceps militaris TaxID=73501 RepID=A0A2H4SLJ0_CORMI|nr:hypothetical protein A9K55_004617 [Cordyceps militaris]
MRSTIISWVLLSAASLASARFSLQPLRARSDECSPCPKFGNSTTVTITQPASSCDPVTVTVVQPAPVTIATVTVTVTHTLSPQRLYTAAEDSTVQTAPDPCEDPVDTPIHPEQSHQVVVTKTVVIAAQKFQEPGAVTVPQAGSTLASDEGPVITLTVQPVSAGSPSRLEKPAAVTVQTNQVFKTIPTVDLTDPCPPDSTSTATVVNTVLVTVSSPRSQNATRFMGTAPMSTQPVIVRPAPIRRRW